MALRDRFNNLEINEKTVFMSEKNDFQQAVEIVQENDMAKIFDELADSLSQKVASVPMWFEYSETEQRKMISDFIVNKLQVDYSDVSFSTEEREHIVTLFMQNIHGFGTIDGYIARDDVRNIMVNCNGSIVISTFNKKIREENVITPAQFEKISAGLQCKMSNPQSAFNKIRFNNLAITVFAPPVCEKKILFEKLKFEKVDFKHLLEDGSLNSEQCDFLQNIISAKKSILVSGPSSSGKTAFLSAIASYVENDSECLIFENYKTINSKNSDRYTIAGLNECEISPLISASLKLQYDYIIDDTEKVLLENIPQNAYFASVNAQSTSQAVTKLAAQKSYLDKCTDKQAKAYLASCFDYAVHLEESNSSLFKVSSISELSLNRAGSLLVSDAVW